MRVFIATTAILALTAVAPGISGGKGTLAASAPQQSQRMRFAEMDRNHDGVITRDEWRGSQRSFDTHDWNHDGRLSGAEVRIGATWPNNGDTQFNDWSEARFRWLDTNRDNRITRQEWRYDPEDFYRVDRNGDNALTLREFLIGNDDDDRGDRFSDLDINNDGRLDRSEWHGSALTFTWLDRNRDGMLSRSEVAGSNALETGPAGGRVAPRTIMVSAREQWADTGIDVRAGDLLSVSATGSIMFSRARGDVSEPQGAGGMATSAAPRPDLHIGALLGKVGNSRAFLIGRGLDSYRVPADGRLFLGVNDDVMNDNSGEFRAIVSIMRR